MSEVDHPVGTRVEIVFGPEIPRDWATAWADLAAQMNVGESYTGKSSPWWYDADAFYELLQAAGARPVRDLVAGFDGCSGGTAGRITAAFKGRSCMSLSRAETTACSRRRGTGRARSARSVSAMSVPWQPCRRLMRASAGCSAPGPASRARSCRSWLRRGCTRRRVRGTISVFVNRTPITGEVALAFLARQEGSVSLRLWAQRYVEFPKGVGLDASSYTTSRDTISRSSYHLASPSAFGFNCPGRSVSPFGPALFSHKQ